MPEEDTVGSNDSNANNSGGGIFAGLMRASTNTLRVLLKGLPGKLPVKTIAKNADQLSAMIDIWDHFKAAKSNVKVSGDFKNGSSAFRKSGFTVYLKHKLLEMKQSIAVALPNFLKTSILGTILFTSFETNIEILQLGANLIKSDDALPHEDIIKPQNQQFLVKDFTTFGYVFGSGVLAGTIHGGLGCCLDHLITLSNTAYDHYFVNRKQTMSTKFSFSSIPFNRPIFLGTIVSHSIVHGALFSVYETSKLFSCQLLQINDLISVFGVMCVTISGMIAGAATEIISAKTALMEDLGLKLGVKELNRQFLEFLLKDKLKIRLNPQSFTSLYHVCYPGLMPGALGFLAYEYGKELID